MINCYFYLSEMTIYFRNGKNKFSVHDFPYLEEEAFQKKNNKK